MLNKDRYKTLEESIKAFKKFCYNQDRCVSCPAYDTKAYDTKAYDAKARGTISGCHFRWLALEAEEENPMPCPFCGSQCRLDTVCMNEDQSSKYVSCTNDRCMYKSPIGKDGSVAIDAHNRVCRAVRAYKESEVKE